MATFKIIFVYVRAAIAQNPEVVSKIVQEVPTKLVRQTFGESLETDTMAISNKIVAKANCIAEAITDAIKQTDYAHTWDEHKLNLDRLFERILIWKNQFWTKAFE